MLDAFDPEESRRAEIKTPIPLGKNISPVKYVVKKEEGGKKKGQTSETIC